MEEVLNIIIKAIISIAALGITTHLVPFIKAKIDSIKDEKLRQIIYDAVYAAQQTLTDNDEKKEYVFNIAIDWAKKYGISVRTSDLNMLIESAVLNMKVDTK